MKNILVTGGAGFLGSHLVFHHLTAGDHVTCVDDFSTAWPRSSSAHLQRMLAYPSFSLVEADIVGSCLHQNLSSGPFDVIYNFACPASPPRYQADPFKTMMTCVVGTRNVLDLAKRHVARVVHASTSEVYGDPNVSPQAETYRGAVNPYGPRACYDEGKRAAEALCFDALNAHGIDARVVRIFNTYGPHMHPDDGRVVSNFIIQALRGQPLTVHGDGTQGRSFCYVDDLIRGIVAMAELPANPRGPINLGNPLEHTVLHLANTINGMIGNRAGVVQRSLPVDDPLQRCPSIERANRILNWNPTVRLEDGLVSTINYFRSVLPT